MPHEKEVEDDTSSVYSESSSSSSSDDESMFDPCDAANELELLETDIEQRKTLLLKLLKGQEGSELAKSLQADEDRVNSFLLERLREQLQLQSEESKPSVVSSRSSSSTAEHDKLPRRGGITRSIKKTITRELQFTLPGTIALLTHCSLYLTIYICINKMLEWICDKGIIYLYGWHISENAFDCTKHEMVFNIGCVILGCCMARWTGSIWDWNENEAFHERLRAELNTRTKASWDMQMIRWFRGKGKHKSKWGPRWKLFIDSVSFFIAYIAVDKLLIRDFATYLLDTRATILEGMPSRQLKTGLYGVDQCNNVVNATADDTCSNAMGNMMQKEKEEFISDVMNWLEHNNRCRWVEKESDEEEDEDEGAKFRPWRQHDEEWKQLMNEKDEQYLIEKVSYKTYYELVGDPSSQFVDPHLENVFCFALTIGGFGVLLALGAPFLLI